MSTESVRGQAGRRLALTPTDFALLAVVLVWGFGYVTFKVGQQDIPSGLFNLLRYGIGAPVLWVGLLASKQEWRMPRKDWARIVAVGLIGLVVYNMAFSIAATITAAANLSLLLALSPIWTVMIQWVMGNGAPGPKFLLGSLVAFAGAGLVIAFGGGGLEFSLQNLRGDMLGVVASILFAWYGIAAKPLLAEHSGIKVQAWINLVALVGILVYQGRTALAFDWSVVKPVAWWSAIYVATMVSVFSHIIWYNAIAKVGPDHVMLAMYLVPVIAAASGTLVLGQPFGVIQAVGALIALVGVALVRRSTT